MISKPTDRFRSHPHSTAAPSSRRVFLSIRRSWMLYGRGSWVHGQFGDSYEYGGGVKWHFLPTERLWLNTELFRVDKAPYSGAFTPYTAGMTGWVPMLQTVLAF